MIFKNRYRIGAVLSPENVVTASGQLSLNELPEVVVVIDDQNGGSATSVARRG